ncbi:hypothetical protein CR51_05720 [Caballeronia megalochromosomata]|nr:hypothetical protein CR51_05720 [Caballeronia megalochromosomata]
MPHMTLLVIAHPRLTASFFQKVVLFDADEQLAGVAESDAGWILDGVKLRKGPEKAQQTIHLSDADLEIIRQVIALTQPLRAYLKARNDPLWRLLFLQCGKGFTYPTPIQPSEDTSYRRRGYIHNGGADSALSASFRACGRIAEKDIDRLTASFSLTTLRASVVVRHYIDTPSIRKLAELLGHESVDMRLVRRYLPPPLLDFFQNRWVRLFQCGLILEAMGDSPYILSAAGFTTLEEMSEFLVNYALKWRPRVAENGQIKFSQAAAQMDDEVVFAVSVDNLKILESLCLAIADIDDEKISTHAKVWRDFANGLFAYIEKSSPPRDDYIAMLALAREQASKQMISKEALYA